MLVEIVEDLVLQIIKLLNACEKILKVFGVE